MESRLELVEAEAAHIEPLCAHLRDVDAAEIRASIDVSPAEALKAALEVPDALVWTLLADGEPVAMGGLTASDVMPGWALVWMVATNWVTDHPIAFTTYMQILLERALNVYDGLYNWVDTRNQPARDWLEMMGFRLEPPEPFGEKELDFHYFWIRSNKEKEAA